jgi:hypothetical protein
MAGVFCKRPSKTCPFRTRSLFAATLAEASCKWLIPCCPSMLDRGRGGCGALRNCENTKMEENSFLDGLDHQVTLITSHGTSSFCSLSRGLFLIPALSIFTHTHTHTHTHIHTITHTLSHTHYHTHSLAPCPPSGLNFLARTTRVAS